MAFPHWSYYISPSPGPQTTSAVDGIVNSILGVPLEASLSGWKLCGYRIHHGPVQISTPL
jgi:hypothetical protein